MTKEKAAEIAQKPEPNFFEFGDAFFECNRCGNYERLQRGIKDGLQFVLPTSDQHEWRLVCGKCKNMMRIFFKPSDEETVKWAKEQIKLQEEEEKKRKEEEALKKAQAEYESEENNKKKRSFKRGSKHNAGADQSDGEGETSPSTTD